MIFYHIVQHANLYLGTIGSMPLLVDQQSISQNVVSVISVVNYDVTISFPLKFLHLRSILHLWLFVKTMMFSRQFTSTVVRLVWHYFTTNCFTFPLLIDNLKPEITMDASYLILKIVNVLSTEFCCLFRFL